MRFTRKELINLIRGRQLLTGKELAEQDYRTGGCEDIWRKLFEGKQDVVNLEAEAVKRLSALFDISLPLLLPFSAGKSQNEKLIRVDKQDVREQSEKMHGATYYFPQTRLFLAHDFVISVVELEPGNGGMIEGGDTHWHPGEEILYVLEGEVEIRLHGSGQRLRVPAHEYLHFVSEQVHSISNLSAAKRAQVVTLRFGQFAVHGFRRQFIREFDCKASSREATIDSVCNRIGNATLKPKHSTTAVAVRHMLENCWPVPSAKDVLEDIQREEGPEIRDPIGFAFLLNSLIEFNPATKGATDEAFSKLAKKRGLGGLDSRNKVARTRQGVRKLKLATALDLGEMLDVSPLLFVDYLLPAHASSVTVGPRDFVEDENLTASRLILPHVPPRTVFSWPRHRLACTPVSIFKIRFQGEVRSGTNAHPGFEIVIPLRGAIAIDIEGDVRREIAAGETVCAHYESGTPHSVCSVDSEGAEALFFRFYEN